MSDDFKYTDIDYEVLLGGAASMRSEAIIPSNPPYFLSRATPYRRTTYRYSPIL